MRARRALQRRAAAAAGDPTLSAATDRRKAGGGSPKEAGFRPIAPGREKDGAGGGVRVVLCGAR